MDGERLIGLVNAVGLGALISMALYHRLATWPDRRRRRERREAIAEREAAREAEDRGDTFQTSAQQQQRDPGDHSP